MFKRLNNFFLNTINHKIKTIVTKNRLNKFTNNGGPSINGANNKRYDFPENADEPNPAKKIKKIEKTPSQIESLPKTLNLLLKTNLFKALNSCLKSR